MNNEWSREGKPRAQRGGLSRLPPPTGSLPKPREATFPATPSRWNSRRLHPRTPKLLIFLSVHLFARAHIAFAIMATIPTFSFPVPPAPGFLHVDWSPGGKLGGGGRSQRMELNFINQFFSAEEGHYAFLY